LASTGDSEGSPILGLGAAKLLAIVGLVLGLLSILSSSGWVSLISIILYLVGMYAISQYYGRPEIFRYAFLASIGVAVAALIIILLIAVFAIGAAIAAPELGAVMLVVLVLLVMYGAVVFMGKFKRDLMRVLGEYSDPNLADLAGKLYWWGAILVVVLVGAFLLLIAFILEVIVLAGLREKRKTSITTPEYTA